MDDDENGEPAKKSSDARLSREHISNKIVDAVSAKGVEKKSKFRARHGDRRSPQV